MYRLIPAFLGLAACNPGGTFNGTLVDGFSGQPRAELRVLAKSDSTDMTCKVKEGTVDAAGNFSIASLCAGDTYKLSLSDETLFVPEMPTVTGGQTNETPVQLKVWRAPTAPGLYKLENDELKMVKTFTDVARATTVGDPPVEIRYPESKPLKLASSSTIGSGAHLVISGKKNIDNLQVFPLVQDTGPRKVVEGETPFTISDHVYVGVKFSSDTDYEMLTAAFDPAKAIDVANTEMAYRYVPADGIAAGRYAVLGEKDKRMYILDFGEVKGDAAPDEPAGDAAAEPTAEKAGKGGKAGKAGKAGKK